MPLKGIQSMAMAQTFPRGGQIPRISSTHRRVHCRSHEDMLRGHVGERSAWGKQVGISSSRMGSTSTVPPPKPILIPRRSLNPKLAILLMRTGYEVVDELDMIAMDQFQILFWKLRQQEWEPYYTSRLQNSIQQGVLADPAYFDFISFAQFLMVDRVLRAPAQKFTERSGSDGTEEEVVRLREDEELSATMFSEMGRRILLALRQGYEGVTFANDGELTNCRVEKGGNRDIEETVSCIQSLLEVLRRNGYCYKADVSYSMQGVNPTVITNVCGSCTEWGSQMLASRKAEVHNSYDCMLIARLLTELQWDDFLYTQQYSEEFCITTTWNLPMN